LCPVKNWDRVLLNGIMMAFELEWFRSVVICFSKLKSITRVVKFFYLNINQRILPP
jgi:hypothetical protein